jgi:hypothetical protein
MEPDSGLPATGPPPMSSHGRRAHSRMSIMLMEKYQPTALTVEEEPPDYEPSRIESVHPAVRLQQRQHSLTVPLVGQEVPTLTELDETEVDPDVVAAAQLAAQERQKAAELLLLAPKTLKWFSRCVLLL